jgi:tetratricopeptide (TPR) repeat protein
MMLLLQLWARPAAAMSAILDRGSLLFACIAAVVASLFLKTTVHWLPISFFTPLLLLAAVYVPGTAALAAAIGRLGGAGIVLQRDYSSLLTCAAMAFAAAAVPFGLISQVAPPAAAAGVGVAYFALLMFFAVRTVFGVDGTAASGVVLLSWAPLAVAVIVWEPLSGVLHLVASPFFLFFAWYYLGGEISGLGAGLRSRQNFRRMLDSAAINPHDGEAQYQIGLVYQHRRQYSEAVERFKKAIAIDPELTDAHFQLARIAREQGRPKEALAYLQTVINQDEKHSASEVLRELGGIYVAAKQYGDARHELAPYVERRPYEPEGLYYYGQTMEGLGDPAAARDLYARAVEADRTAPRHRRRYTARWSRLAQKALGRLR